MARYRLITVEHGHPMARRATNGSKPVAWEHRVVLFEKIGPGTHPCHWCSTPVTWGDGHGQGLLFADHLNNDPRDNRPENLVPSCCGCNVHRHHPFALVADDEAFVTRQGKRRRAVQRTCEDCGGLFLAVKSEVAKGNGRFCSRSCRARATMRRRQQH